MSRARGAQFARRQQRDGARGTAVRIYWQHPTEGKQFSPWFRPGERDLADSMAAIVELRQGKVTARDREGTLAGIRNGWDAAIAEAPKSNHKDTLRYWHERAIQRSTDKGARKQTTEGYWDINRNALRPFHNRAVSNLTLGELAEIQRDLSRSYSPNSVNTAMARIYAAINLARQEGFISVTPDRPRRLAAKARGTAITVEQFRALSEAITDVKTRRFIGLQLVTGMRPGEVAALRKNDLLPANMLRIDETLNSGRERVGDTKTGEPRIIRIAPTAWASLAGLAEGMADEGFLFSRVADGSIPPHRETYRHYFREARKRLAAQGVIPATLRLHDMRHTAGSWLLDDGRFSAAYIAQRQGQSLGTFTRTYAHAGDAVLDGMAVSVAEALEAS